MVITVPAYGSEQAGQPMNTQWSQDEESSNSSGSNSQKYGGRKRRPDDNPADDQQELKRQKNREAAKRCRDKKLHQTEELRKRNEELEEDNRKLAEERESLVRKCRQYQQEIEQHKLKGCSVPHFQPPQDLEDILNQPPSPCHTSDCSSTPSPAPPSVSNAPITYEYPQQSSEPAPPVEQAPGNRVVFVRAEAARADQSVASPAGHMVKSPPGPMVVVPPEAPRVHYIKVKNKTGGVQTLCMNHEQYVELMNRLPADKKAQVQAYTKTVVSQVATTRSEQVPAPHPSSHSSSSLYRPQQQSAIDVDAEPDNVAQHHYSGSTNAAFSQGGERSFDNLDTIEDLFTVLRTNMSASTSKYDFVPVNPNDVKMEPLDYGEYDDQDAVNATNMLLDSAIEGIKHEVSDQLQLSENGSADQWFGSTGQRIREGLDTVVNQDQTEDRAIKKIVHFLQNDSSSQSSSIPTNSVLAPRPAAGKSTRPPFSSAGNTIERPPEVGTIFVTTPAKVGSLTSVSTRVPLTGQHKALMSAASQSSATNPVVLGNQSVPATVENDYEAIMPSVKLRQSVPSTVARPALSVATGRPQVQTSSTVSFLPTSMGGPLQQNGTVISPVQPIQSRNAENTTFVRNNQQQRVAWNTQNGAASPAQNATAALQIDSKLNVAATLGSASHLTTVNSSTAQHRLPVMSTAYSRTQQKAIPSEQKNLNTVSSSSSSASIHRPAMTASVPAPNSTLDNAAIAMSSTQDINEHGGNLMSLNTRMIFEYLTNNSIEALDPKSELATQD